MKHIVLTKPNLSTRINVASIKVWDEITYPFPNFNRAAVDVWGRVSNFISHFTGRMITDV